MSNERKHYLFSVDQYELMIKHAVLGKYDLVELLRGEILDKVRPVSALHSASKSNLSSLFHDLIRKEAIVSPCGAIRLKDSMPEPDLFLLKPRTDNYRHAFPTSAEVLLVVEIADETLDFDRIFKSKLYAENGIPEYWIHNLNEKCIERFWDPQSDGTYAGCGILTERDVTGLIELPDLVIDVTEIVNS
jgi:Uma2 family endonuclease